ncbi:hypothetical protein TNCV_4997451 [Trichonephila clavipes]|nr:hypothetical protein TNCV_4997451 [Trichonephila clavipes]
MVSWEYLCVPFGPRFAVGGSEPAPVNRLVISLFGDNAAGLVLQIRGGGLPHSDAVVLYSGWTPGKRPPLLDSVVGDEVEFALIWIQCNCALVKRTCFTPP